MDDLRSILDLKPIQLNFSHLKCFTVIGMYFCCITYMHCICHITENKFKKLFL